MAVRAKFQLYSITEYAGMTGKTLTFICVYDPSLAEDVAFSKASPNASITQFVDNPAALAQFTLGSFYYFDASSVPAPAADDPPDGNPVDLSEPVPTGSDGTAETTS